MVSIETEDRELFDRIADFYCRKDIAASSRIARRNMLLRAIAPIGAARGGRLGTLVELGCGPAASAVYLAGRFDKYIGIDHSAEMIAVARQFTSHVPSVELRAGNAKSTDLPDQSADTVLMVGVLHHIPDLDTLMHEVRRIAKPGGSFVCIEPHRGNPAIQLMRGIRGRIDPHYSAQQHFFTKQELLDLCRRHELNDLRLRYFTLLTQPFAQVILKPQVLSAPLSRLACALDPVFERLLIGELGRLTWQIAVTGTLNGPRPLPERSTS